MPRGRPKGSKNISAIPKERKKRTTETSDEKVSDNYRGKELIKDGMKEYDVLCIVRDAMRGEHSRFDWIKFLLEYRNTSEYDSKKRLIHKYAPSVVCN